MEPCGCLLDQEKYGELANDLLVAHPEIQPRLAGGVFDAARAVVAESEEIKSLPVTMSSNRCPICECADDEDSMFPVIGYGYDGVAGEGLATWVGFQSLRCGHKFKIAVPKEIS